MVPNKANSESLSDKIELNISITESGGLSLYINLKEDLSDPYMTLNLAMDFHVDDEHGFDVVKRTVNCCQLFNEPSYATEVQFLTKILVDHSHFPVNCPVKKDLYYVEDFKVPSEKLPELMAETSAMLNVKLSVKDKSKFKILANCQVHFSVTKIGNVTGVLH